GVGAVSTCTQKYDDEGHSGKREIDLVPLVGSQLVDPVLPRDGRHRHHHVSEQRDPDQAGGEAKCDGDGAAELDQPSEYGEELSGMKVGRVGHEVRRSIEAGTAEPPEQLRRPVVEEDPRKRDAHENEGDIDPPFGVARSEYRRHHTSTTM